MDKIYLVNYGGECKKMPQRVFATWHDAEKFIAEYMFHQKDIMSVDNECTDCCKYATDCGGR